MIDEYEDYDEEYKENLNLEELAVVFGCENGNDETNRPVDEYETQDITRNTSNVALCSSNNAIAASNTAIDTSSNALSTSPSAQVLSPNNMSASTNNLGASTNQMTPATPRSSRHVKKPVDQRNSNMPKELRNSNLKERTGDIDVWWLYDDGGKKYSLLFVCESM